MFKKTEILDSKKHKNLRFKPVTDFAFATDVASAPLSVSELIEAAKFYPVSFSLKGPLLPIAMLSLKGPKNAFMDSQGKWIAPYIPAHIRRYPFIFGAGETPDKFTLMADIDAPQFNSDDGEDIYTEDGKPGPILQKSIEFLKLFQKELEATENVLKPLTATGVLTTNSINVAKPGGGNTEIKGVRAIDQKKLMALGDATLAAWVRSGLMGVIYAHAGSLKNLGMLEELEAIRTKGTAPAAPTNPF